MKKFSKDGVIVEAYLDTRKGTVENTYPVKIKVTYKRIRKYYPTGKYISVDHWQIIDKTKVRALIDIREDIENSYKKVRSIAEELIYQGDFSFDRLNIRLGKVDNFTINDCFKSKIESLKNDGRIGNMTVYTTILNKIVKLFGKNVFLESVTPEWLKNYEKALRSENKLQSTISIHLRTIRAIMNEAKEIGLIKESQYPFGKKKFEIQEGTGRKLALTLEQIGRIARYECESLVTERYRDMWLFIYLCNGINVADLIHLKYKNIVEDEIYYIRQKTKHTTKVQKEIVVTLSEPMRKIIKKWGNPPAPNNYLFPILSGETDPVTVFTKKANFNRELNKRMAFIAKELGLPKISTYTARHSFATVLKRSGANIAFISESLGHTDLKTTENYLASFEKDERKRNASLLLRF